MQIDHADWKLIMDLLPIGVLVVAGETVLYRNSQFVQLFGRDAEQHPATLSAIPGPGVVPHLLELEDRCLLVTWQETERNGVPARAYFLADQTETEGMRHSLSIYKACFDSITDLGLFACDHKGKIILYNTASAKSDGNDAEQVVGKNLYDLFGAEKDTGIRRVLATGQPVLDYQSTYTGADGREVQILGSAYPIRENGRLIGAFSVNRFHDSIRQLLLKTIELQRQLISSGGLGANGTRYRFDSMIGEDPGFLEVVEVAKKAALSAAPVMLYGETGTGKEVFAQSIHNAGVHKDQPYLAVNCAAIPANLLESTLFGTVKGSFTGADNMPGLFEQAGAGTLFLDEINSIPLELQSKLLRVLQEKTVRRVGGKKEIPVHCRILSASNCSPVECVNSGALRADLYYRLAVICIEVPPLRERKGDVVLLAEHFLQHYAPIYGIKRIPVAADFWKAMTAYSWPGNVRELRHVVESSIVLLSPGEELSRKHISPNFNKLLDRAAPPRSAPDIRPDAVGGDLKGALRRFEREAIQAALRDSGGNISRTAKAIGYTRSTLQYQMSKLDIHADDYA